MRRGSLVGLASLALCSCFQDEATDQGDASSGVNGTDVATTTGGATSSSGGTETAGSSSSSGSDTTEAVTSTTIGSGTETGVADWWDAAWTARYPLAFNNGGPGQDLVDVPILVVLTPSRIDYSDVATDGRDIRFVAGDDETQLAHEIESWTPGGTSYVWIRMPTLNLEVGEDRIFLYVGNDEASDDQDPASVWSNGYDAVFHLSDDFGADATSVAASVGASGDVVGGMSASDNVEGQAGSAIEFDGDTEMISFELDVEGATAVALEVWARPAPSNNGYMLSRADLVSEGPVDSLRTDAVVGVTNGAGRYAITTEEQERDLYALTIEPERWTYLALTWDSAAQSLTPFRDGAADEPTAISGTVLSPLGSTWAIANSGEGLDDTGLNRRFEGAVDEVRVSTVVRSAIWIEVQHASMADELLGYGVAETLGR